MKRIAEWHRTDAVRRLHLVFEPLVFGIADGSVVCWCSISWERESEMAWESGEVLVAV